MRNKLIAFQSFLLKNCLFLILFFIVTAKIPVATHLLLLSGNNIFHFTIVFGIVIMLSSIVSVNWLNSKFYFGFNLLLTFGIIYFKFVYQKIRILTLITTYMVMVVTMLFIVVNLYGNIHNKKMIRLCILKCCGIVKNAILLLAFCAGVKLLISGETSNGIVKSTQNYCQEYAFDENLATISKFVPETFDKLSNDKRLEVCQALVDAEGVELGIYERIMIYNEDFEDAALACYMPGTNSIKISNTHLSCGDSKEIIDSICHEVYHAYQSQLIGIYQSLSEEQKKLRYFDEISEYEYETLNYINGTSDFFGYYTQALETNARKYACIESQKICKKIGIEVEETKSQYIGAVKK